MTVKSIIHLFLEFLKKHHDFLYSYHIYLQILDKARSKQKYLLAVKKLCARKRGFLKSRNKYIIVRLMIMIFNESFKSNFTIYGPKFLLSKFEFFLPYKNSLKFDLFN